MPINIKQNLFLNWSCFPNTSNISSKALNVNSSEISIRDVFSKETQAKSLGGLKDNKNASFSLKNRTGYH